MQQRHRRSASTGLAEQIALPAAAAELDQPRRPAPPVSMPSATDSMPSPSHMARMARTMCSEGRSSRTAETKLRSIFSLSKWKLAQPAERRLAGAEIVERNPDAAAPQVVDDLGRRGGVGHQAGLGDLDLEAARVEAGAVEDGEDLQPVFWSTSWEGDRLKDRNRSGGQLSAASVALRSSMLRQRRR